MCIPQFKKFSYYRKHLFGFAHDFDGGISVNTISGVLGYLIKSNIIQLDQLNNRIETFPYSGAEKPKKPRPLFFGPDKRGCQHLKVKQSAAEMLFCQVFRVNNRRFDPAK